MVAIVALEMAKVDAGRPRDDPNQDHGCPTVWTVSSVEDMGGRADRHRTYPATAQKTAPNAPMIAVESSSPAPNSFAYSQLYTTKAPDASQLRRCRAGILVWGRKTIHSPVGLAWEKDFQ